MAFPRDKHTNWLSSAKWAALEIYIQITYRLTKLCFGICLCVYVYMSDLIIHLKGDHAMNLKEGRKGMWECLEGEKGSNRYFNYL